MRILEYAGIPFVHKSEFPEIAAEASAFGANGDTFAPPILKDGDFTISQSTACAMYAGEKAGINNFDSYPKALQYISDLVDLFELAIGGAGNKGGADLKQYLTGDRFKKVVGNIERSIKGPFYFGDKVSTVYITHA